MTVPNGRHDRSRMVSSVRKRSLRLAIFSTTAMALSASISVVSATPHWTALLK